MAFENIFNNQSEYSAMLTIAREGSTIGQRMNLDTQRPIPEEWQPSIEAIRAGAKFPETLQEYIDKGNEIINSES